MGATDNAGATNTANGQLRDYKWGFMVNDHMASSQKSKQWMIIYNVQSI
jgi:hypothetical protein